MDKLVKPLSWLSGIEYELFKEKFSKPIKQPVFVCGLARSGTSITTRFLNTHKNTGSFLYKDLPFIQIPYFWSFCSDMYYRGIKPHQRAHKDGLNESPETPDAFEEILWKQCLEDYDKGGFCKPRNTMFHNTKLKQKLNEGIKKVLYVRKANRYLAKGNYNVFRIPYILKMFPDAKIILCIRDPFDHCHSLTRVHEIFLENARENPYIGKQLEILGHYEFGPQRRIIKLKNGHFKEAKKAFDTGDNFEGYLWQWLDVYQFVLETYLNDVEISKHCLVLDNGTLQTKKKSVIKKLFSFSDLKVTDKQIDTLAGKVRQKNIYKPENIKDKNLEKKVVELYKELLERL